VIRLDSVGVQLDLVEPCLKEWSKVDGSSNSVELYSTKISVLHDSTE
jgi:hypothetical protein